MGTGCLSLPEILCGPSRSHAPSAADPSQRHCAHTSLHSGGSPLPAGYKAHKFGTQRSTQSAQVPQTSPRTTTAALWLVLPAPNKDSTHGSAQEDNHTTQAGNSTFRCTVLRLLGGCLTAHFPLTHTFDAVQCPFYMNFGPEWLCPFSLSRQKA